MRIGIIICDRYRSCGGEKCFRSARNHEGAFARYKGEPVEIVAYTSCGGCPGGNVETAVAGMKKHGAQAIHFASGVLAGYPPCPYLDTLVALAHEKTGLPVVIGTHPMPTNYIETHEKIGDWTERHKEMLQEFSLVDPEEAKKYDSSQSSYTDILSHELSEL